MCTERKATGLFVLASFLFATMRKMSQNLSSAAMVIAALRVKLV